MMWKIMQVRGGCSFTQLQIIAFPSLNLDFDGVGCDSHDSLVLETNCGNWTIRRRNISM